MNHLLVQDSFKNALTDKIGQALDDKRKTVANDWLNAAIEHEEIVDNAEMDKPEEENEPVVSQTQ